jgi:hypothetical protein
VCDVAVATGRSKFWEHGHVHPYREGGEVVLVLGSNSPATEQGLHSLLKTLPACGDAT